MWISHDGSESLESLNKITKNDFLVVGVGASWCFQSELSRSRLKDMSAPMSDVDFTWIDTGKSRKVAYSLGVKAVPAIVFIREGSVVGRFSGLVCESVISDFLRGGVSGKTGHGEEFYMAGL